MPVDDLLHERPSYAMSPRAAAAAAAQVGSPRAGGRGAPALALPDQPPFKAYIGNVPYELDEEVIEHFFRGLKVRMAPF